MPEMEQKQVRGVTPPAMVGTIFDDFLARFEEKLADPQRDRNEIVRDTLYELYLSQVPNFKKLVDYRFPIAARASLATFDPRNVLLEAEYHPDIDLKRYYQRKPLIWFWQMFDRSPLGMNAYLGFKLRQLLAPYIFNRVGENFRCYHGLQVSFAYNLSIGDHVTIHRNVILDDRAEIEIGNHVVIEDFVNILSGSPGQAASKASRSAKTIIGDGVRISHRAIVLAGARVASGTVVPAAEIVEPEGESLS